MRRRGPLPGAPGTGSPQDKPRQVLETKRGYLKGHRSARSPRGAPRPPLGRTVPVARARGLPAGQTPNSAPPGAPNWRVERGPAAQGPEGWDRPLSRQG